MPYLGSKPADKALEADDIAANAITTAKIVDDAVDRDKINLVSTSSVPSLEAKGDGSSQDGYIQLNCSQNSHGIKLKSPPHSAAQSYTLTYPSSIVNNGFMKTDSSGNLSFATVSSGLALLQTVTASNDSNVKLNATAGFDGTYDSLVIVINGMIPDSDGVNLSMQVITASSDPVTSNSYFWAVTGKNQSDITSTASSANAQISLNGSDAQAQFGSAAAENANYVIEFSNPDSTSLHKLFMWRGVWSRDDTVDFDATHVFGGGSFRSTTAVTGIHLEFGAGNIEAGTFRLYGRVDS